MTEESDTDDTGYVIFSLLVNSEDRLDALEGLPGRDHPADSENDNFYVVYTTSFEEPDWSARADRVDACIHEAVDALVTTGVRLESLRSDDVTVRAFFTFPRGAETISAEALQRLASCHATIWIDVSP